MTIQIKKLTEAQIANLEDKGARRWTKYGKDRIYISGLDKASFGLDIDYYKTGNVCCAKLNGEEISNSKANDILASLKSGYIDLTTDELVLVCYRRSEEFEIFAENLVKAIETEVEEPTFEDDVLTTNEKTETATKLYRISLHYLVKHKALHNICLLRNAALDAAEKIDDELRLELLYRHKIRPYRKRYSRAGAKLKDIIDYIDEIYDCKSDLDFYAALRDIMQHYNGKNKEKAIEIVKQAMND